MWARAGQVLDEKDGLGSNRSEAQSKQGAPGPQNMKWLAKTGQKNR